MNDAKRPCPTTDEVEAAWQTIVDDDGCSCDPDRPDDPKCDWCMAVNLAYDERRRLRDRIDALTADCERERMRLAAVSSIALGYATSPATDYSPDFHSGTAEDVQRLRDRAEAAEARGRELADLQSLWVSLAITSGFGGDDPNDPEAVFDRIAARVAVLTRALATLRCHSQQYERGASVKTAQRLGMAQTYATAALAGSSNPMEQVERDWSDETGALVTRFETLTAALADAEEHQ